MGIVWAWIILLSGLLFVAAAVVGYPAWMRLRGRGGDDPPTAFGPGASIPRLAVVLVVRNEQDRVAERLANLAATHYPCDRLSIIVVDDASDDGTPDVLRATIASLGVPVTLLRSETRKGKPAALNLAFANLDPDVPVVAFADARQRFLPSTLPALVAALVADPLAGAVSGSLVIAASGHGAGGGVGRYWEMERALRRDESRSGSCVGCTGAVYAIRRSLWAPIPEDTLVDDVVIPMGIAARGYRIRFSPAAVAEDPQPLDPAREQVRKRRTLAGNFQFLLRHPSWSVPGMHPLACRLFWHKTARLLVPLALGAILAASTWLAVQGDPLGTLVLASQLLAYAVAAAGLLFARLRHPVVSLPAAFLFLQVQVARGFLAYLRGDALQAWQPASPSTIPHEPGRRHA